MSGYKDPPREHQFPPGRSGNPKGRPRKRKDQPLTLGAILAEKLKREVTITQDGISRKVPYSDVLTERFLASLAMGKKADVRSLERLFELVNEAEAKEARPIDSVDQLRARIEKMVELNSLAEGAESIPTVEGAGRRSGHRD